MRILITGILGLIGSELATQLHAAGHELIGNDDLSHNCVEPRDMPAMQTFTCKVDQLGYFTSTILRNGTAPLDLIIHCASPVGHARLTPEAEVAWQIVSDTQAVLDQAERTGARLITFSSSEVLTYRGETDIRAQYALGKLTSEAMVLGHPRVNARVVRPYNVTGRRQRADGGFVMARFRDAALKGEPLTVFGTGVWRRHFIHVQDFARFICLLIEKWPEQKLWSVANPQNGASILKLAQLFWDQLDTDIKPKIITGIVGRDALGNSTWRDTPERPLATEDYIACCELGWEPRWSLISIVQDHLTTQVEATSAS